MLSLSLISCGAGSSNTNDSDGSSKQNANVVSEEEVVNGTIEKTVTCDNKDVTEYTNATVTSTLTSVDIFRDKYVAHFTVSFDSTDDEVQELTLSTGAAGLIEWAGSKAINVDPDDDDPSPIWDGTDGYGSDKTIKSGETVDWEVSFDRTETEEIITQLEIDINWAGWLNGTHKVTIN